MNKKKTKKQMNPETKEFLKVLFGSLISNDRAILGAKTSKWFVGVIMGVLAVLLPLIPITVTNAKTYGSSFISSKTYGFDKYITETSLALSNSAQNTLDVNLNGKKVEFKINDNNELLMYVDGVATERNNGNAINPIHNYVVQRTNNDTLVNEYGFQLFYTSDSLTSKVETESVYNLVNDLTKDRLFKSGTLDQINADAKEDTLTYYLPSLMILSKDGLFISINKEGSSTQIAYYTSWSKSTWTHTEKNVDLFASTISETPEANRTLGNKEFLSSTLTAWKDIINETYKDYRKNMTLATTFICLGGYSALLMLFGFILWIVTRGKRNIHNYLTWWNCTEIAFWCSFAPALLSLIGGFVFSTYALFYFVIFMGIRMMWLVVKQLKPTDTVV